MGRFLDIREFEGGFLVFWSDPSTYRWDWKEWWEWCENGRKGTVMIESGNTVLYRKLGC